MENMENKYKVGDKVRVKATNEEGVVESYRPSSPFSHLINLHGITISFREGELCDPAPVKVGDILVEEDGDEMAVLDVFENTFIRSSRDDFEFSSDTCHFKEIEKNGWKIKGQESDKTQESMNLLKKEGYKIVKE